jgi:hypothetical protein
MGPPKPLYRVRVSSSGLIYAVIVGAWAAYLVPMWLRRQDELNEARPTERFSTAIRLLSGKAGMERRYAKEAERRETEVAGAREEFVADASVFGVDDADGSEPDSAVGAVDVRAFADPKTMVGTRDAEAVTDILPTAGAASVDRGQEAEDEAGASSTRNGTSGHGVAATVRAARNTESDEARRKTTRAKVLARRRRTTMVLFLAFTIGTVVAAVGGLTFLWAPVAPGALLSAYIVYLRVQERRRFAALMDRRCAEAAAQRLRERRRQRPDAEDGEHAGVEDEPAPFPAPPDERPGAADRRALVERTDHAEWVDQQRGRDREQSEGEGWDPVPVPLPTYVSAPVAPRSTRGIDLEAPGTWSSARSSTGGSEHGESAGPTSEQHSTGTRSRGREHGRTPLFDQYDDEERPRAANE